jgi:asparagine synthase (glutamine-hydrolysing)
VLGGNADRLATLKQEVVSSGVRAVLGIDMPLHPKRRFQDGATGRPRTRATKAWCRSAFNTRWQARLREADALDRRSGNEMTVAASA